MPFSPVVTSHYENFQALHAVMLCTSRGMYVNLENSKPSLQSVDSIFFPKLHGITLHCHVNTQSLPVSIIFLFLKNLILFSLVLHDGLMYLVSSALFLPPCCSVHTPGTPKP